MVLLYAVSPLLPIIQTNSVEMSMTSQHYSFIILFSIVFYLYMVLLYAVSPLFPIIQTNSVEMSMTSQHYSFLISFLIVFLTLYGTPLCCLTSVSIIQTRLSYYFL